MTIECVNECIDLNGRDVWFEFAARTCDFCKARYPEQWAAMVEAYEVWENCPAWQHLELANLDICANCYSRMQAMT